MLITQGLHWAPWLPCSFPPHPLSPFLSGGRWEKLPWLSRHGPLWGGRVLFHLCCGGLRLRPLRAAPRGMGVGVDRCPLLLPPPPPPWGGFAPPPPPPPPRGGGGGAMPSPLADDPARAAVSRREMSPKISANPREGWGGDGDAVVSPPHACVSARATCRRA